MSHIRSRAAALAAAVAATLLLSPAPAMADKLVVFKNGKALLVKSVEENGQWLKVSFGGDDWMSVPAFQVAEITDADLGNTRAGASPGAPNQMVQGEAKNYSNRGGSVDNSPRASRALNRGNDGDNIDNDEELDARAGAIRRGVGRSTARTTRSTQQNNPLIPGLTPLNTNQNGRSGLLQRRGRFSDRTQAVEPDQQDQSQEKEDDN